MTRRNKKKNNILKSDFNFRLLSKHEFFSLNLIIRFFLVLILLTLTVLFYLEYKTTQRLDSLFMNYQNLFDRQLQINAKLEEYIKQLANKEIPTDVDVSINNSQRFQQILERISWIVIIYFAAVGITLVNEVIQNPSVIYQMFSETEPFIPNNTNRILEDVNILQTEILPLESENPDDDNRITLPLNDPNVVQIIPGPGEAIIFEHNEN